MFSIFKEDYLMSRLLTIQEQNSPKKPPVKLKAFFQRMTNTQIVEETPIQILHNELRSLQKQLELKEINFIHAEPDYIDVAIMELEAVRVKYSITVRQIKEILAKSEE
jgi:hypothetical protein